MAEPHSSNGTRVQTLATLANAMHECAIKEPVDNRCYLDVFFSGDATYPLEDLLRTKHVPSEPSEMSFGLKFDVMNLPACKKMAQCVASHLRDDPHVGHIAAHVHKGHRKDSPPHRPPKKKLNPCNCGDPKNRDDVSDGCGRKFVDGKLASCEGYSPHHCDGAWGKHSSCFPEDAYMVKHGQLLIDASSRAGKDACAANPHLPGCADTRL